MSGYLCSGWIYEFEGLTIEIPGIGGPTALKPNGDPYYHNSRQMREKLMRFANLSDEELEAYRVGGGCRRI